MRTRPLREVSLRDLSSLLDEESAQWQSELGWDFSDVRAAVATGIDRGTLAGRVASEGPRTLAYCYYMVDASRVIIGSLFAAREHRGRGVEDALLGSVVADARAERGSGRIECQTLFCTSDTADERFGQCGFTSRPRHYMRLGLGEPAPPEPGPPPAGVRVRPLRREDLQAAAEIVYRSHLDSVDAALNLTYTTPASCRAFVDTLVLRSGCGRFDSEASSLAEGPKGPLGVLVASRLALGTGHICQVSVTREAQGHGLGGALMQRALRSFHEQGLAGATLSVTVANGRAYRLYERLGFRVCRRFAAHAWVRAPGQIELPA